jgi:alpha-glucosidase
MLTSLILAALTLSAAAENEVTSPDGQVVLRFSLADADGLSGRPTYSVQYCGRTIVRDCRLGLELQDAPPLDRGLRIVQTARDSRDSTWQPVWGERAQVRDHYQQLTVDLEDGSQPPRRLRLTFRAYDEGVAMCYTIPEQAAIGEFVITAENTEFRFTDNHLCHAVYSAQGVYQAVRLDQVKPNCERPLTVEFAGGPCVAVAEARLVDYARMRLRPVADRPHTVASMLGSSVTARAPYTTPWRVILLADSPGQLLERNDVILNLNDPCAIADTSWIKPGKVIREVTLTTVGGKACVDFAVRHRLQYVEFDAGWYGHEYSDEADAREVNVDPKRSPGPLDLHEVIRYAGQHGIGILLYVNRRALERQLDEILPLYRQWGVKGVKYGFVQVGSQQWTRWLHEAVRKAAEHRLMVDIHDEYRPTGYSRTYPNLMTQEGIAGDETSPANSVTLTILFTRMLAGAADNTVCYYDQRVARNASHAYQLAKPVCLFSPWQFLFWYDRPSPAPLEKGGAGNARTVIGEESELEFYAHLPATWDETRVLHGQIGQYAVIARRHGAEWYLGGMNSGQARTLEVPLNFLDKNRKYVAHVYSDDPQVPTRTHVKMERVPADAGTVLEFAMSAQGGQAVRVVPADGGN